MEIIDSHVHLYPPELNRAPAAWASAHGEKHWALLCTRTRKDGRAVQDFPSVDDLLRTLDASGVARAILQGWYWETPESCAWQNRFYAECVREHPDRLRACAALHPGAGGKSDIDRVRDEVRRAAESGFVGLGELSPHSQGVAVDNAALLSAFELAGELGLAVNCHVTETSGDTHAGRKKYPGKIETPLGDFVRWAQQFPRTRFVLAHWGARLPLDARWGAAARELQNVFYDTAASPLIYGAGMRANAGDDAGEAIWREMCDAAGAGRILFGTDFPLVLYPKNETATASVSMASLVDEALRSDLRGAELSAIFAGNARRVFGLA